MEQLNKIENIGQMLPPMLPSSVGSNLHLDINLQTNPSNSEAGEIIHHDDGGVWDIDESNNDVTEENGAEESFNIKNKLKSRIASRRQVEGKGTIPSETLFELKKSPMPTPDETRKEKERKQKNKEAAKRSRDRKNQILNDHKKKIEELKSEVERVQRENKSLRRENELLHKGKEGDKISFIAEFKESKKSSMSPVQALTSDLWTSSPQMMSQPPTSEQDLELRHHQPICVEKNINIIPNSNNGMDIDVHSVPLQNVLDDTAMSEHLKVLSLGSGIKDTQSVMNVSIHELLLVGQPSMSGQSLTQSTETALQDQQGAQIAPENNQSDIQLVNQSTQALQGFDALEDSEDHAPRWIPVCQNADLGSGNLQGAKINICSLGNSQGQVPGMIYQNVDLGNLQGTETVIDSGDRVSTVLPAAPDEVAEEYLASEGFTESSDQNATSFNVSQPELVQDNFEQLTDFLNQFLAQKEVENPIEVSVETAENVPESSESTPEAPSSNCTGVTTIHNATANTEPLCQSNVAITGSQGSAELFSTGTPNSGFQLSHGGFDTKIRKRKGEEMVALHSSVDNIQYHSWGSIYTASASTPLMPPLSSDMTRIVYENQVVDMNTQREKTDACNPWSVDLPDNNVDMSSVIDFFTDTDTVPAKRPRLE